MLRSLVGSEMCIRDRSSTSNEMSPGEATSAIEKPLKEMHHEERAPTTSNEVSSNKIEEAPVTESDADSGGGGNVIPEKEILTSSLKESPVKEIASTFNPDTKENKEFTSSQDEFYENTDPKKEQPSDQVEHNHYLPSEDEDQEKGTKLAGNLDNFKAGVTPDMPLEFKPSEDDDRENSKAASLSPLKQKQKKKLLKQSKEDKLGKGKKNGKQFKVENSKFKPKFIPITKSSSPDPKESQGEEMVATENEDSSDLKKITDETTSERPGALSQTMEYHSGNGKEHVSEHPQHTVDYEKMFSGKMQEKAKNGKNGFFKQKILSGNTNSANMWQTPPTMHNDQSFLPEDLGLTPIHDQFESVSEQDQSPFPVENHVKTTKAVAKMNIPKQQNHKIINLLGAIEQAAKQTASMAQSELQRIDQGQQSDLPAASKRILEVKSKKINALLNSLNGEEDKDKLGMETRQLQNVIRTLGDVFSQIPAKKKALGSQTKSPVKSAITIDGYQVPYTSEVKPNRKSSKPKSLLDFHPIKITNNANKHGNKTGSAKDHKIRSFLKAFEKHLEDITSLRKSSLNRAKSMTKVKKQPWQKPISKQHIAVNHLYRAKAADNVTTFPFQLPFATSHSPNPILPSPVIDSEAVNSPVEIHPGR